MSGLWVSHGWYTDDTFVLFRYGGGLECKIVSLYLFTCTLRYYLRRFFLVRHIPLSLIIPYYKIYHKVHKKRMFLLGLCVFMVGNCFLSGNKDKISQRTKGRLYEFTPPSHQFTSYVPTTVRSSERSGSRPWLIDRWYTSSDIDSKLINKKS